MRKLQVAIPQVNSNSPELVVAKRDGAYIYNRARVKGYSHPEALNCVVHFLMTGFSEFI